MLAIKLAIVPLLSIFLNLFPALTSALQEESIDKLMQRLPLPSAVGPESLAFDRSGGGPYTGVSDGRILKWQGEGLGWGDFGVTSRQRWDGCNGSHSSLLESICGRPLGLQFYQATGNLYIADAYFGLSMVGPEGGVGTQLATEADGAPFHFLNGLDVDQDTGMVYFTDSSNHFRRREYFMVVLTGDATGRLLRYDPESKKVTVLMKGIGYPNGVAVSEDNTFVLVAENTPCRILRYWIRGPRTGTTDVFAQLPGYPDNIKKNTREGFWVAVSQEECPSLSVSEGPSDIGKFEKHVALRLSKEGRVLEQLDGSMLISISEVEENNGTLWVGSVSMPYVGVYKL